MTSFRFTMPGSPPSWNHMYKRVLKPVPDGAGGYRKIAVQAKTSEASTYQADLTMITRTAKPSSFKPEGHIIVAYSMYLAKANIDADNVIKACNDAIALGLGVNDKRFLPVVMSKHVDAKNPRLEITVCDADYYGIAVYQVGTATFS